MNFLSTGSTGAGLLPAPAALPEWQPFLPTLISLPLDGFSSLKFDKEFKDKPCAYHLAWEDADTHTLSSPGTRHTEPTVLLLPLLLIPRTYSIHQNSISSWFWNSLPLYLSLSLFSCPCGCKLIVPIFSSRWLWDLTGWGACNPSLTPVAGSSFTPNSHLTSSWLWILAAHTHMHRHTLATVSLCRQIVKKLRKRCRETSQAHSEHRSILTGPI